MRLAALTFALTVVACAPFVRPPDPAAVDGGTPTASVLALNGGLASPGAQVQIAPTPVALSPKIYLRKSRGSAPSCYYGIFVADPSAAGQPNNGLLLVALGDMNKINNDPNLGGQGRTSCPTPDVYAVGGPLPDGTQIGDQLQASGILAPYCEYYDTSLAQCTSDPFPEFQVATVTKIGAGSAPPPTLVDATQISDESTSAVVYAGNLVQVQNVTVADPEPDAFGDVVLTQGSLWVQPLVSSVVVPAKLGYSFTSITGILHYQFSHWKLRPRTGADIVPAPGQ